MLMTSTQSNQGAPANSHHACSFEDAMIFDYHYSRRESGHGGCGSALDRQTENVLTLNTKEAERSNSYD